MRVLYLTKYSRKAASSRLRSYQYFPYLEEQGFEITVKPLFNDIYLDNLYQGKKSIGNVVLCYLKRFFLLFTILKYDKVVIEKELFPYLPAFAERVMAFLNVRYIVDYDDAIFHNYDLSKSKLIRFFLSKKIDKVMKYSGFVIAGNDYLATRAKNAGAKNVIQIPTVIDIDRYHCKQLYDNNKPLVIGWIGSPSTFKYIKNIFPALEKVIQDNTVLLHLIGMSKKNDANSQILYIPWEENTEVDYICQFDIGIMPLENTPWELGKCSYKLIQYMGCGIPVVASSIGMNNQVVEDGSNGFLVENEAEWIEKISVLLNDPLLRKTFGKKGRLKVEQEFSIQNRVSQVQSILTYE